MSNLARIHPLAPELELIERAAAILKAGGLVAFPTETVYGLGADALNAKAVRKIFTAKDRPGWDPLIVHINGPSMARPLTRNLPPLFYDLADRFWPGPLTLVVEKHPSLPAEVTAGRSSVALRMPRHPVIGALLAVSGVPIAAPSANRFGAPSPTTAAHVLHDLGDRVDLILDAGPTPLGVESTVLDLTSHPPSILRPGDIGREMIEAVIGPVSTGHSVAPALATDGQPSPGLSLRHYSPRATIELFNTRTELQRRANALRGDNRRVAILQHEDDLDELAHTLYAQLRQMDDDAIEIILALLPPSKGLGVALRDRLLRAAGQGEE